MTPMRITPHHLPAVADLERRVFASPWSEQSLALLCSENAFGFAVCEGDAVIAYAGMLTVLDEGQITNVATHPDYRRRGFAALVLTALLEEARSRQLAFVTLEARESNEGAIALYRKLGFEVVGKRPRFYTNPTEAAWIMQCELK